MNKEKKIISIGLLIAGIFFLAVLIISTNTVRQIPEVSAQQDLPKEKKMNVYTADGSRLVGRYLGVLDSFTYRDMPDYRGEAATRVSSTPDACSGWAVGAANAPMHVMEGPYDCRIVSQRRIFYTDSACSAPKYTELTGGDIGTYGCSIGGNCGYYGNVRCYGHRYDNGQDCIALTEVSDGWHGLSCSTMESFQAQRDGPGYRTGPAAHEGRDLKAEGSYYVEDGVCKPWSGDSLDVLTSCKQKDVICGGKGPCIFKEE